MSCNDEGFEIFNLFAGRLDIRIKNCLRYVRMYIRCQLGLFMHGKFFDTYLCTFFTASHTQKKRYQEQTDAEQSMNLLKRVKVGSHRIVSQFDPTGRAIPTNRSEQTNSQVAPISSFSERAQHKISHRSCFFFLSLPSMDTRPYASIRGNSSDDAKREQSLQMAATRTEYARGLLDTDI